MQKANDINPRVSVGVQTWSRGKLFPAVIACVEEYDSPMGFEQWKVVSLLEHHEKAPQLYRNYLANFFERTLDERLIKREWVLHYPGTADETFASREGAEARARVYNDWCEHPPALEGAWVRDIRPAACLGDTYGEPYVDPASSERYGMRTYHAYTPEELADIPHVGGSPVPNKSNQRRAA